MIFPREVLRSVKDELLVGASTATTATTTAVDGSASSSSVSIVDDDEEEEEADSDEKKNKKKKLKPKKKKRYAIAMYVDSDDHVYGLYSILRRAVTTGMVNDGIEIAVAVSKHMTDAEDERLEAIERQKPSWIESKMSMIKDIRTEIESNRAAISASSSATTTTTNNDNNEMMDALLEKRDALFASKREITTEIREGRHIDAKLPKEELPEGNIAVRKLREWHRDGLIHTIYPINSNYIQDIVRYSGVWEGVFNKLFLFNLTEYDKIIRLDCDVLIRTNLMHWFEYDTPCAIQAHDEIEWNSGVMVITPNATVFDDMISRLPDVTRLDDDISSFDVDGPDGWNSGVGEQGFLSSYFTNSDVITNNPSLEMKTMPTENAICVSTLGRRHLRYFWHRRNHLIQTVHLTTEKPWYSDTCPTNRVQCDVLREWEESVNGIDEKYDLPIPNSYPRRCPNETTTTTTTNASAASAASP